MTTDVDAPIWVGAEADTQRPPRRRVRGLRLPAVPSWPLLAQLGGGISTLAGVYLQWGPAITLITGGVAAAVVGMLREAGRI
jgi:hypothetical protein